MLSQQQLEKFLSCRKQARIFERQGVIQASAELLWPYLTHLPWLHQQAEMPVKNYLTLPTSGGLPRIQMQWVGQNFICEEMPCEWQTPRFFRYEWLVLKGPCHYLGWTLQIKSEGECSRVKLSLAWGPAQTLIKPEKVLLPYLDALEKVWQKVETYLAGTAGSERLFQDKQGDKLVFAQDVQSQWQALSTQAELPQALAKFIFEYPNFNYPQLNPVELTSLLKIPLWEWVLFFIRGLEKGLFDACFQLLAPDFTQQGILDLDKLKPQMSAAKFQLDFVPSLDRHVVVTFLAHLHLVEQSNIQGHGDTPGCHPEIDWQVPLLPGQRRILKAPQKGHLNLLFPPLAAVGKVEIVKQGAETGTWRLEPNTSLSRLRLKAEGSLILENACDFPCYFQRVNGQLAGNHVSLAQLLAVQQIRDFWPQLQLPLDQRFQIAEQTFFCVSLPALAEKQQADYHTLLAWVAYHFYGALVQRQEGTVLFVFPEPLWALKGALWLLQRLLEWQALGLFASQTSALLALHRGPCLVYADPRLRYLGHGVRRVMEILEYSRGQDLILSSAFFASQAIQQHLAELGAECIQFFPPSGSLEAEYLVQVVVGRNFSPKM